MKWTEQETKEIIEMIKNGNSYESIVIKFNRSKQSIKCKLRTLGETYEKYNKKEKEIKTCVNCGGEITSKHGDKFCNNSCSASYNNKKRKCKKHCISCGGEIDCNRKYCSPRCHRNHEKSLLFEIIKGGDVTLNSKNYKNYLIHKYGKKCMECGWCEFNEYSKKIPIELEHIDGNSDNNELGNLKLLCPNCHSLTPTYKALNSGNGRHKRMERYYEGKSF